MKLNAKNIRRGIFVLAVITAIPLPVAFLDGLLIWLSPMGFANRLLGRQPLHWLNVLGVITLGVVILRKRWLCRYACPAGVICDSGSSLSWRKPVRIRWKPNRILALTTLIMAVFGVPLLMILDPFNIFYASLELIRTGPGVAALIKLSGILFLFGMGLFLPHAWCTSICPLGGFQDMLYGMGRNLSRSGKIGRPRGKTGHGEALRAGRRGFLAALAGSGLGILLPRIAKGNAYTPIRPPFAMQEDLGWLCVRCGNCAASCPTKIIEPAVGRVPFESYLCPVINFSNSYCLPECNRCGQVCPSGAIRPFSVSEKAGYRMAAVQIELDGCLLLQNRECIQCGVNCAYGAITFAEQPGYPVRLPRVDPVRCTGCAACKIVCPTQAISVETISVFPFR